MTAAVAPRHQTRKSIRVLIVDDSATLRAVIAARLRREADIEVVGEAADPYEARDAINRLHPDVLTLDLEMPRMDGLAFLEKLMKFRPMPVVVVSSWTQGAADATVDALALGAFDCVAKPLRGNVMSALEPLPDILRAAVLAPRRHGGQDEGRGVVEEAYQPSDKVIAIGASTGGVEALMSVISRFPVNCPPTVITQHIPGSFSTSFAARLNQNCRASVCEAFDGAPLDIGKIYLAPGGSECHLGIEGTSALRCRLVPGEPVSGHRPSVDMMFKSISRYGSRVVGVILTGMGRDGAEGMVEIRRKGGATIGQDEASSIVYGMPKAAMLAGGVEREFPITEIGAQALRLCAKRG